MPRPDTQLIAQLQSMFAKIEALKKTKQDTLCHLVWFWPLISWPKTPPPAKMLQIQPQVIKCFGLGAGKIQVCNKHQVQEWMFNLCYCSLMCIVRNSRARQVLLLTRSRFVSIAAYFRSSQLWVKTIQVQDTTHHLIFER